MTTPPGGERAVYRRAGLPVGVLHRLRFPRVTGLIDDVLADRERIAGQGRSLADALHPVIGRMPPDDPARPRVIGLRRALHRGRRPAGREWSPEIAAHLPDDLAPRIAQWLADVAAGTAAEATIDDVFATEEAQRRSELRTAAADPGFLLALDGTSPVLARELRKWIATPSRVPRDRIVWAAARYLARAAAKTSPLSAFLTTGPVAWAADGPAVADRPGERYGVFELSCRMLREEIAGLVAAQPGVREDALLGLNPTAALDGERIVYIDGTGNEVCCAIPARASVRSVVELLRAEASGLPRRVLRDRLAGGDPALGASVDAFLDYLLQAGLLVSGVATARVEEVLGAAASWLRSLPATGPIEAALAAELAALDQALAVRMPVAAGTAYRDHRQRLVAQVQGLAAYAGDDDPRRALLTSVTPLHVRDTVVSTVPSATCSARDWRPVHDDLDVLRRWLAPFSPTLPVRLILTEALGDQVRARGTMPVVAFYREYQRLIGGSDELAAELVGWNDRTAPMAAAASGSPSVRRLAEVRDAAAEVLAPHPLAPGARAAGRADRDEVLVPAAALATTATGYPAWVPPLRSVSAGLQPVPGTHPTRVVVTATHVGFGSFHGRLRHLTGAPVIDPEDVTDGPIYAGFRDRFGLPFNDQRTAFPYLVGDPPYLLPDGDRSERLAVTDLSVSLDDESGLLSLWSQTHRRRVHIVHTGLMAPTQLPPFSRLLTVLSGETPPPQPAPTTPMAPAGTDPPREHVWPRLTVGSLTICRSGRWIPASTIPVPAPGESNGRFLCRLTEWRSARGLPERCFFALSPDPAAVASEPAPETPWAIAKWRKPMYLDFGSWFLVQGFLQAVRRPGTAAVVFEEALPDPLAPGTDPDYHVAEWVLDVTAPS